MSAPRTRAAIACFASVCALAACTVGPDYVPPSTSSYVKPDAQEFASGRGERAIAIAPVPDDWWKLYNDPRLDALIRQAIAANTNLRAAAANLERSHALLQQAKTLQEPGVALNGGVERAQLSGELYLQPVQPPISWDFMTGVSVGYDLDLFGRIKRGIEAASAEDEAAAAAHDLVLINVVAGTAQSYGLSCGVGLQLIAAERSLELQRQSLALTQRLMAGGRATELDVTRQRQLVSQLEEVIPDLRAARNNELFQLAVLTGRPPADYDDDLKHCANPPRLLAELPVGDSAALLKRRPDVREAERELAAATAEIGVATAELYPDIQIGVSAGSGGLASDAFGALTNFWSYGVGLQWQANQSAARAKIAAANAGAKLALANFDGTVLQALREAESALNTYVHDLRKEQSAIDARDEALLAVNQAQRLELAGKVNQLSVLDAQRTLAAAELSLAQLETTISSDQIKIFLALGGGWQQPNPEQAQRVGRGRASS